MDLKERSKKPRKRGRLAPRVEGNFLGRTFDIVLGLAECRDDLKTRAVGGDERERERLNALDLELHPHTKRGARELDAFPSLTPSEEFDVNASIAQGTPLANLPWYKLGETEERQNERFLGGWRRAHAALLRLVARAAEGEHRSLYELRSVETRVTRIARRVRSLRVLAVIWWKYVGAWELDGITMGVERLLEALRDVIRRERIAAGSNNVKGRVPKRDNAEITPTRRRCATSHPPDSPSFDRACGLCYARTRRAPFEELATSLGVSVRKLRSAILSKQTLDVLRHDLFGAALVVLEELDFGPASTSRYRILRLADVRKTPRTRAL